MIAFFQDKKMPKLLWTIKFKQKETLIARYVIVAHTGAAARAIKHGCAQ